MNDHLATYPIKDGVKCLWLTNQPNPVDLAALEIANLSLPKQSKLEMSFRRIVLGMSFDPLFLCVVGERHFQFEEKSEDVYVVLDEAIDTNVPSEVIQEAIVMKDKYRALQIFAPSAPSSMAESLRMTEGLTHYGSPQIDQIARQRWPSFADFDCTAGVNLKDHPSDQVLTSELNDILSTNAVSPKTQMPLLGSDGVQIPKVLFLDDMPMLRTLQSVRTGALGGSLALWNAVRGLQTTGIGMFRNYGVEDEHLAPLGGNSITGY